MDLLVVGAGTMGRWVARTVDADVAFADADADAAREAADACGGRVAGEGETFAAVCVAVPIPATPATVERWAPRAERALLDVTGVMAPAIAAMRDHAPGKERVSTHPLFAPGNAPGNVAVVPDDPGPVTGAVLADVEAAGNRVFETTAEEHDRAMESVQAAAHAAVLAYALAAEPVREPFATPVSEALVDVVETVTGGPPDVYREIQAAFEGADRVADAARRVADAEGAAFDDLYREAAGSLYRDADADADGSGDPGAGNGSQTGEAGGTDDAATDDAGRGTDDPGGRRR
jgi:prephenate dehydrogenase